MYAKAPYTIVIPAYNEALAIADTISEIKQSTDIFEIIVVDDGSTDDTFEIVKNTGVKVLNHTSNRGYGAALKTGIRNAKHDLIVITDADGTYPNGRIPELVNIFEVEDLDMLVGARIDGNINIPLVRKPAKWTINKFANLLAGVKIPDLNSGLRVMKKEVVEKYYNILPDGFSLTSTITLSMLTNGYKVKYVPIEYYKRKGKSKIRPIRDTFNFIQLLIRTALYFNPLKVFIPLAVSLVILAFAFLFWSKMFFGKFMDVTFGVILMTAVMVMVIGMLADLIDKRLK